MTAPVIVWLRQDLRLADQPAFAAAAETGAPVIPVYVLDDDGPGDWAIGGAQRWWLHHSLKALDGSLHALGSRLILRRGTAAEAVATLAEETGAAAVHAVRHYEPWWVKAEDDLAGRLDLRLHDGNQLAPPETIRTGSGTPFKVFSPFWRALGDVMPPPQPVPAPKRLKVPVKWPESDALGAWKLLPAKPDWSTGFDEDWTPGEAGAAEKLDHFLRVAKAYEHDRNLPSIEGSSRLSPHLHHGEISPAAVWHALDGRSSGVAAFRRELGWRDFTSGVIRFHPQQAEKNARPAFDKLEWRTGKAADADFAAWTKGRTGYPIVDAGMRQLWTTGWLHNRVRMIAASFSIKHLLLDWRRGERWYWDCLVDADYGNNSVNWQWVAGTGFDSNMFGRIIAPLAQSEKFDAGDYIRRWVPELAALDDDAIHDPHGAGVAPKDYAKPLIGHKEARARALAAGRAVRG